MRLMDIRKPVHDKGLFSIYKNIILTTQLCMANNWPFKNRETIENWKKLEVAAAIREQF